MCGSSLTIAASSWNAPGMKTGLSSCGERERLLGREPERAVAASYST